jgi:preprotein translocase subunit SecG
LAQWQTAVRIIQIVLCAAVILFILLQVSGAGLGSAFGAPSSGASFKTRRGVEKLIFNITIIFVVLFSAASLVSALLH